MLGPNFWPSMVAALAIALVIGLLGNAVGVTPLPASEEMKFLSPGGWIYVGTSSIASLWTSAHAHRLRTLGSPDDQYPDAIKTIRSIFTDACLPLENLDSVSALGIDTSRGAAGAVYGTPFSLADPDKLDWLVSIPLSDARAFEQTWRALSGASQRLKLSSPALPRDGAILFHVSHANADLHVCDDRGRPVSPGRPIVARNGSAVVDLASTATTSDSVEISCRGADRRGNSYPCACAVSDDPPPSDNASCQFVLEALKSRTQSLGNETYRRLESDDGAGATTSAPVVFVGKTIALFASQGETGVQALQHLADNAALLSQDRTLISSSQLLDLANAPSDVGWIAGDVQAPSPLSAGRSPVALRIEPGAITFAAHVSVEHAGSSLLESLIAPSSSDERIAAPSGAMASLELDSRVLAIWNYIQNWLPELHKSASEDLGYFGPILDSLDKKRLSGLRVALMGFDRGVPEIGLGTTLPPAQAAALIDELQSSQRAHRDQLVLEEAWKRQRKGLPAQRSPDMSSLEATLSPESGASWASYRYAVCQQPTCEGAHFAGSPSPLLFDRPEYKFRVGKLSGRLLSPPVTDNDLLLGAYAARGEARDTKGLLAGRYRTAAVYRDGTLWIGANVDALHALLSDDAPATMTWCDGRRDASTKLLLCVAPDLLTEAGGATASSEQKDDLPWVVRLQNSLSDASWLAGRYRQFRLHVSTDADDRMLTVGAELE